MQVRQLTLDFICKLLKTQQEEVPVLMRASMFEVLRCQEIGEDTPYVLEVLIQLTRMGQDIEFLEAHISIFLIDIMPTCLKCVHHPWAACPPARLPACPPL